MYEADDIGQYFLNNSEKASQENVHSIYCQICSSERPQSLMFTISENCDQTHKFCITCLQKKVVESINRNEDVYCPIDYCPCILSESCRFFSKMSNNIHNKYVIWKASKQYLERNKSFRQSRRSLEDNYFNYAPVIKKQNEQYPPVLQEKKKQNEIEIQPPKKKKQKKNKKQNKVDGENKQKYLDMSILQRKKDRNKKGEKKKQVNKIKKEQQVQIPLRRNEVAAPIPFHAPKGDVQPQIKFTCCQRAVKLFLMAIILPVLLIVMAILILSIFVIYLFMLGSIVGSVVFIVGAVYFMLSWIATEDQNQELKKENLKYSYFLFFAWFASLGFAKFFTKYFNYINYLVITNSWLWWIKKVNYVLAYPHQAPTLYLGPRNVGLNNNQDILNFL